MSTPRKTSTATTACLNWETSDKYHSAQSRKQGLILPGVVLIVNMLLRAVQHKQPDQNVI